MDRRRASDTLCRVRERLSTGLSNPGVRRLESRRGADAVARTGIGTICYFLTMGAVRAASFRIMPSKDLIVEGWARWSRLTAPIARARALIGATGDPAARQRRPANRWSTTPIPPGALRRTATPPRARRKAGPCDRARAPRRRSIRGRFSSNGSVRRKQRPSASASSGLADAERAVEDDDHAGASGGRLVRLRAPAAERRPGSPCRTPRATRLTTLAARSS